MKVGSWDSLKIIILQVLGVHFFIFSPQLAGKMSITDAPQLITSSDSKILTPSKKEEVAEKIQKRRSQELKKEDVSEMKVDKEDKENKVKKDNDAMEISPKRDESESSESESESDEENEVFILPLSFLMDLPSVCSKHCDSVSLGAIAVNGRRA